MRINCESCGSRLTIRSSREITKTTKELYCNCSNAEQCGATYSYTVSRNNILTPPRGKLMSIVFDFINNLPDQERTDLIQKLSR